jgi:hypothetical protein
MTAKDGSASFATGDLANPHPQPVATFDPPAWACPAALVPSPLAAIGRVTWPPAGTSTVEITTLP